MKVLYIESKLKNLIINLSKSEIAKLPKKIFLAYSVQYKDLAISIKNQLEKNNIKISNFQQVLGCSKIKTKDPIFFIGSGRFHASNLYNQAEQIYVLENNKIIKISDQEINRLKQRKRAALLKFLNAENIGILITTKPCQENLKIALSLKERLEKREKQVYLFLSNNIDINQFENFPIDSWINTACPGLSNDNSQIINYQDIIGL